MKQEINTEEIWQNVLHSHDMYIDYDLRGYSAIITAMKMLADRILDLAAENATGNIYNIPGPGNLQRFSINENSILQIKDWIK